MKKISMHVFNQVNTVARGLLRNFNLIVCQVYIPMFYLFGLYSCLIVLVTLPGDLKSNWIFHQLLILFILYTGGQVL